MAGMTAYRPRHGAGYAPFTRTAVPEEQEEDAAKGPGIRINNNDTDPDGEDDLIEVEIKRSSSNVELALHRGSGVIKVFRSAEKQNEISFTSDKTAALSFDGGNTLTVFVEWADTNHGTVDLHLEPPGNNNVMDTVRFHTFRSIVVTFDGMLQTPPNGGASPNAIWLYERGYDAHMFAEDDRGAAKAEIQTAVQKRKVEEYALIGYSRGGGAVYSVTDDLQAIGVPLRYTCYIDAYSVDFFKPLDPEDQYPPKSEYHVNFYQRRDTDTLGIGLRGTFTRLVDGGPVPKNLRLGDSYSLGNYAHVQIPGLPIVQTAIQVGAPVQTVWITNPDDNNASTGSVISPAGIITKIKH
ncbi:MAG: hypothetical protein ACYC26_07835 [Phycisphaerales bacterium]